MLFISRRCGIASVLVHVLEGDLVRMRGRGDGGLSQALSGQGPRNALPLRVSHVATDAEPLFIDSSMFYVDQLERS